jgi:hypothetical protein
VSITQDIYQADLPSLAEDEAAKLTAIVRGRRTAGAPPD